MSAKFSRVGGGGQPFSAISLTVILTENVSRLFLTCTRELIHVPHIMESNLLSSQVFEA